MWDVGSHRSLSLLPGGNYLARTSGLDEFKFKTLWRVQHCIAFHLLVFQ